ncbi:MAG: 6-phosphogluconolactonase [Chloroflexi bacterium]|nr:MAG: 6-phosphogluconolactonase [Chloroflexota bacterium]
MTDTVTFESKEILAIAAATKTIQLLNHSIDSDGAASWVLAGGSTPMLAYEYIAAYLLDEIDWSKVTVLLGDERCGPLDGVDNNWHAIDDALLQFIPQATLLRPMTDVDPAAAATAYTSTVDEYLSSTASRQFSVVWLGMGPDGHTLSLFPDHDSLKQTTQLVIPVYDSPKPPSERVSFTLAALQVARTTIILAAGSDKRQAFQQALQPDSQLPIAQAARRTNATWFVTRDITDV